MTVIEQIQEKCPFLTRKQREVADYMLEDPERMSYVTLREISQVTGWNLNTVKSRLYAGLKKLRVAMEGER